MTKQYIKTSLNMGMLGIQQIRALYFTTPFASADHINLSRYKIQINEPIHDIANQIKKLKNDFRNMFL